MVMLRKPLRMNQKMKNEHCPIILFVYNRPWHTIQTIEALKKNILASDSILYVFADAAKKEKDKEKVNEVRDIIEKLDGFKEINIIAASENIGCADSIIKGIDYVMDQHDRAIIVEDDIVTSPDFLQFMNKSLDIYEKDERIFSISGYNVPMKAADKYKETIFLSYRYSSWGWATWKNRWDEADWGVKGWEEVLKNRELNKLFRRGGDDLPYILKAQMNGTIDAWDIRWYYSHFKKNRFTVFPVKSLVENIGFDGSGIHCGQAQNAPNKPVISGDVKIHLPENIEFDQEMNNIFLSHYKYGLKDKIRRFLKELIGYKINKVNRKS